MSDLLIFALCHFRSPGDQWKIIGRPLPDYCCYWFNTFRFFAFLPRQLHPLSPTFPLTKLLFFNPTLVFRSLVCSPLHTLHQTGRKTRVGFGAETSCSRAEVWFGSKHSSGGGNGNDLTKTLTRINASGHHSNILQLYNTVQELTQTFHSHALSTAG